MSEKAIHPYLEALARRVMEHGIDREKLAAEEAARTDPWRWYCRLCGAKGEAAIAADRDAQAVAHMRDTRCGQHEIHRSEAAGRLLHVWSYPRSAAAQLN